MRIRRSGLSPAASKGAQGIGKNPGICRELLVEMDGVHGAESKGSSSSHSGGNYGIGDSVASTGHDGGSVARCQLAPSEDCYQKKSQEEIFSLSGAQCSQSQQEICGGEALKLQSFCDVGRIARVFSRFDAEKIRLLRHIGFDAMVKMPYIKRLDDHFTLWLMSNLDSRTMHLKTPSGEVLPIKDMDVHLALGIPFKGDKVIHDLNPDKELVSTIRSALFMDQSKASLSLEYLEEILVKDYGMGLSNEESVAFKYAAVLYCMAYFLGVHQPMHCFPIWLIRNLSHTLHKEQINWSGYVLSVLSHGARQVQIQLQKGYDCIQLYGCGFLLQVLYLDNLNMGSSTAVYMDHPRCCVFKQDYLKHLIALDREKECRTDIPKYGTHKMRSEDEVSYSRSWKKPSSGEFWSYDSKNQSFTEIIHRIMQVDGNLAALLAPELSKLSVRTAAGVREAFELMYTGYTLTAETRPEGTFTSVVSVKKGNKRNLMHGLSEYQSKKTKSELRCSVLKGEASKAGRKVAKFKTEHHIKEFVLEDGPKKKLVRNHSMFGKSPFEMGFCLHHIPFTRRVQLYSWLEEGDDTWGNLTRLWIQHDYPTKIALLGYNLRTQLSASGSLSSIMIDAITRSNIQLDDFVYRRNQTHWRHFLPPRFAECIISGESYLQSQEIMSYFTGDHIKYNVENCRMITAPVYHEGIWSCYFWDFMLQRVTVLDPTKMRTNTVAVELHHGDFSHMLTDALFACISRFFSGWNVDHNGWEYCYPSNHGPPCDKNNSGLYAVLYSRYFNGEYLVILPNMGGPAEPRSALLYQLLTMEGNRGDIPDKIQKIIYRVI